MAFGGSMIIVFINSFVSKFIPNDKKIMTSAIITAAYNMGAALVVILFLFLDFQKQDRRNKKEIFRGKKISLKIFYFKIMLTKMKKF